MGLYKPNTHSSILKSKRIYKIVFWIIIFSIFMWIIDSYIRPTVTAVAVYQAKIYATDAINTAVEYELEKNNIEYDKIATVNRSSDGELDSVECDMTQINKLKTSITDHIFTSLMQMGDGEVRVPFGTLFGGSFFSGMGPEIPLRMMPAGYVSTEFENKFESAGINQTRHSISVNISVNINILIPGYPAQTEVVSSICVAETIIVGKVPQGYTYIAGDEDSSVQSKVNDYGAFDISNGVDIN